MMTFNQWREQYGELTFEQQREYYNELEVLYPDQAHFNLGAAMHALSITRPEYILEAGAWKGDLAAKIFPFFPGGIKFWNAIELSTNAIEKTVCKSSKFGYINIKHFDWWDAFTIAADLFLSTHFIEHLSNDHFTELVSKLHCKYVYFESPLTTQGEDWKDYHGTHALTFGWQKVHELMKAQGYEPTFIAEHCYLYTHENFN